MIEREAPAKQESHHAKQHHLHSPLLRRTRHPPPEARPASEPSQAPQGAERRGLSSHRKPPFLPDGGLEGEPQVIYEGGGRKPPPFFA